MRSHGPRQRHATSSNAEATEMRLPYNPRSQHELLADEYARVNGLSIDSEDQFVSSRLSNVAPIAPAFATEVDGLTSCSHLHPLRIPPILPPMRETLTDIPQPLYQVPDFREEYLRLGDSIDEVLTSSSPQTLSLLSQLKIEPPLLQTDHEYDCRELSRSISLKRKPDLDCKNIPTEPLNQANDEGISFPRSAYCLAKELARASRNEKFDVPQEAMTGLIQQLQDISPKGLSCDVEDNHHVPRNLVSLSFRGYLRRIWTD